MSWRVAGVAVAVAMGAAAHAASGQPKVGAPSGAIAEACSTLTAPPDARRVNDTIFASLRRVDMGDALPASFVAAVINDVRSHWIRPAEIELPVFGHLVGAMPGARSGDVTRGFSVEFGFSLHGDGRITGLALSATSTSALIDKSVLRALKAADSAGWLPPIAGLPVPGDSAAFSIRVFVGRDTTTTNVAMAVLSVPVEGPFVVARPIEGSASPHYPDTERRNREDGSVYITFVIDESGRVVPGTRQVQSFTSRPFLVAVLEAMQKMEFTPARLHGCAVKNLVSAAYVFRVCADRACSGGGSAPP